MYTSEIEGRNRRGWLLGRWKVRIKEFMSERGKGEGFEQAKRECLGRKRWMLFCNGHPLHGSSQREQGIRDNRLVKHNLILINGKSMFHCIKLARTLTSEGQAVAERLKPLPLLLRCPLA